MKRTKSECDLRIVVSVFGRFHVFDLASELTKQKILLQLFTSYPKSIAESWGIPGKLIISFTFLEILNRLHRLIFFDYRHRINYHKKIYDFLISLTMSKNANVYICWGGPNHRSIRKAKRIGCKVILESGSTHIRYQEEILNNEFKAQKVPFVGHDRSYLDKEDCSIEMVDKLMVPSSFVKRSYVANGVPEDKILVNPYGVDLSKFKKLKKEDAVFRFIFCGRLSFRKGTHYLLKAFHELNMQDAELMLIGPIEQEIKEVLNTYTADNVKYIGPQKQRDLSYFFSQGNVFVLPSLEEGLALVQAQAMACGLPLICTTNTGGEDLLSANGKEGFILPIRDTNSLKNTMLYMYENRSLCAEMGDAAKLRVTENFTWAAYGDRYVSYLNALINE